jgi:hypothetical protein
MEQEIPDSRFRNKGSFRFGSPAFAHGYPDHIFSGIWNPELIVSVASLQNLMRNGSRAKKCIRLYDFFDAFM